MDDRRKQYLYFGAAGGGLALIFLLSRRSAAPQSVSLDASVTSAVNRLIEDVQEQFSGIAARFEAQEAALTEGLEAQEAALAEGLEEVRTERTGLLAPITSAIETFTNQIQSLFGRTEALERETVSLQAELKSQSKQIETQAGQISAALSKISQATSGAVTQAQAQLMAEDTRYQAALAAALGRFSSDYAYWADSARRSRMIQSLADLFGLGGQKAEAFKSHAESTYKRLGRGELGSAGIQLTTLLPGPDGFRSVKADIPHDRRQTERVGVHYGLRLI